MRSMTLAIGVLSALGVFAATQDAQAADPSFGRQGQMAFSADRLFGLNFNTFKTKVEVTGPGDAEEYEWEDSSTQFNFLWSNPTASYSTWTRQEDRSVRANVSTIPRLSFDYFVIDGLSVGGSIGYMSLGGTQKVTKIQVNGAQTPLPPDRDHTSVTALAFAPRVGYAYMFNQNVGIWPRGGITYYRYSAETKNYNGNNAVQNTTTETFNAFDLNLEAMFVISPVNNFAFVVGPVLDYGLSGSVEQETSPDPNPSPNKVDITVKHTNIGIAAGLLGYF